jgi:hypothetical protein
MFMRGKVGENFVHDGRGTFEGHSFEESGGTYENLRNDS